MALAINLMAMVLPAEAWEPVCAKSVHAITLRGGGPGEDLQMMRSFRDRLLVEIPGSNSFAFPYPHGLEDHAQAVHDGAQMLQDYIKEYVTKCPGAKIILAGWSLVSDCWPLYSAAAGASGTS